MDTGIGGCSGALLELNVNDEVWGSDAVKVGACDGTIFRVEAANGLLAVVLATGGNGLAAGALNATELLGLLRVLGIAVVAVVDTTGNGAVVGSVPNWKETDLLTAGAVVDNAAPPPDDNVVEKGPAEG